MTIRPVSARATTLALSFAGALSLGGCHRTTQGTPAPSRGETAAGTAAGATATMRSSTGASLGVLRLEPVAAGVRIAGTLTGLTPGEHGIHLHAVGRCEPPAFTSAGGHFNPTDKQHGLHNPAGPHAGDLPVIRANDAGVATVDLTTPRVTLDSAATTGLFDADGTALVVHAGPDDQQSDPAGNSGARVACGVVERA
ncbi:MAG TPA: superoxide dismutase family protein [Gemmatimonadales bacterium]|nr:superoxide dismutase family protein [Gemmatimonadales bacterium]